VKTNLIPFAFLLLLSFCISGCTEKGRVEKTPPNIIEWQKSIYFQKFYFQPIAFTEKREGGFLVSGAYSGDNINGYAIVSTDKNADSLWSKSIQIAGKSTTIFAILQGSDDIIISGQTIADTSSTYFENSKEINTYVAWLDLQGNIIRYVLFPVVQNVDRFPTNLFLLSNGNICLLEQNYNQVSSLQHFFVQISCFNNQGELLETHQIPNISIRPTQVELLSNESLLIPGISDFSENYEKTDMTLLLSDVHGNELLRKSFIQSGSYQTCSAIEDEEDGYIFTGTESNISVVDYKLHLFPVSNNGIPGVGFSIADSIQCEFAYLKKTSEGTRLLFCYNGFNSLFIISLNDAMHTQWKKEIEIVGNSIGYDFNVSMLSDNSLAFILDRFLVKTIPIKND
jgi:hypothetical protein